MFKRACTCVSLCLILGLVQKGQAEIKMNLEFDQGQNTVLTPGSPHNLILKFEDTQTGTPLTDFMPMHEKLLHLLIIKKDLSHLAHIHPELSNSDPPSHHHGAHPSQSNAQSVFKIGLNQPHSDPDNQDTVKAIPDAGDYLFLAEGMSMSTDMSMFQSMQVVTAKGPATDIPLQLDRLDDEGNSLKYFEKDGTPSQIGAYYQIKIQPALAYHCGNHIPYVRATIQFWNGNAYEPVTNLENWLGVNAHAIFISNEADVLSRSFGHAHSLLPDPGPNLILSSHLHGNASSTNITSGTLHSGKYRIWLQMKHEGNLITFPFAYELTEEQPDELVPAPSSLLPLFNLLFETNRCI